MRYAGYHFSVSAAAKAVASTYYVSCSPFGRILEGPVAVSAQFFPLVLLIFHSIPTYLY